MELIGIEPILFACKAKDLPFIYNPYIIIIYNIYIYKKINIIRVYICEILYSIWIYKISINIKEYKYSYK